MLSCKEFVQQSAKIIENEELSLGQKIENKFHLFFCHHCRRYLRQAKTTVSVAKTLNSGTAPEQLVDETVLEMKKHSATDQQETK